MRDFKILVLVSAIVAVIYWGIEPLAHSVMHPHMEPADYDYPDTKILADGNATLGKELVIMNCTGCHGLDVEGIEPPMDDLMSAQAYGVVPPDLSTAGAIYHTGFLAEFIKNPAKASQTEHKFTGPKVHPMPGYDWMGDSDIANIITYFEAIAPKTVSPQKIFEDACLRCHDMRYAKLKSTTPPEYISKYMGVTPPDLSMMIRSRGNEYIHNFINAPQRVIPGTAMPRVGLTGYNSEQVVKYIEKTGDVNKEEREKLGVWVIGYLLIVTFFAFLWKRKIWKPLK